MLFHKIPTVDFYLYISHRKAIEMINYNISNDALHIEDGYKYNEPNMQEILRQIRTEHSDKGYNILKRTDGNLINEWKGHNLCYKLGLFRTHTKDIDFEYPQNWFYKVGFFILSRLYNIVN